jgi:2-(1,2-epoxy-1,2-dihydrophenyl)acetyl-CoA isomerase
MSELVLIQVEGGVATLSLNRPQEQNALTIEMSAAIAAALAEVAQDTTVRCVVLRGSGGRFSVGGDFAMLGASIEQGDAARRLVPRRVLDGLNQAVIQIRSMQKPVIGVLEGAVAGGALSLVLACDFVIAEDGARLVYAYDALGISPDAGGSYVWPRLLGERAAMELALFGGAIKAQDALAKGVINRAVPRANLDETVASIAAQLAAGPTMGYGRTKRLIYASSRNSLAEQLEAEAVDVADCLASDDFADALKAFAEKRKPKFEGH